jgi:signal transduction histidine kinase
VNNAINYTVDNKIEIAVSLLQNSQIRFAVRDYGCGIKPDEQKHIWERYYRTDQNHKRQKGTGIGLSIVKSILISHGAKFGVESVLEEGSTFWFEIPQTNRLTKLR